MTSWHAVGGYLILLHDLGGGKYRAQTVEEGRHVSCRIEDGKLFQEPGTSASATCLRACAAAVEEREDGRRSPTAQDAMSRYTDRFGASKHPIGNRVGIIERRPTGGLTATVQGDFDSVTLHLDQGGVFSEPIGNIEIVGVDGLTAIRDALRRRLDWEMSARLV